MPSNKPSDERTTALTRTSPSSSTKGLTSLTAPTATRVGSANGEMPTSSPTRINASSFSSTEKSTSIAVGSITRQKASSVPTQLFSREKRLATVPANGARITALRSS